MSQQLPTKEVSLSLLYFANNGSDFARFAVCTGHNGFRSGDMHRYALNDAAHANLSALLAYKSHAAFQYCGFL